MVRNPKVDSALHIVKGAVQHVLGAHLTTSTYAEGEKGRLTVSFGRKPTDEEMSEVGIAVDRKLAENVPLEVLEMEREEAEAKFGDAIYDKFRVPEHIKQLKILCIKDWNMNCCAGTHVERTGDVKINIVKWRFRGGKNELEISFAVE